MRHYDTERVSTIGRGPDTVTITVRYDGRAWHAEYVVRGVVVDDSSKIWHPDMPRRRDAVRGAMRIAIGYRGREWCLSETRIVDREDGS